MPTTMSAAKRLRSGAKRHLRNQMRTSLCRTMEKKFLVTLEAKDVDGAKTALKACLSAYDKAAKTGTIHANKAARKKERLTAKLKAILPKS